MNILDLHRNTNDFNRRGALDIENKTAGLYTKTPLPLAFIMRCHPTADSIGSEKDEARAD